MRATPLPILVLAVTACRGAEPRQAGDQRLVLGSAGGCGAIEPVRPVASACEPAGDTTVPHGGGYPAGVDLAWTGDGWLAVWPERELQGRTFDLMVARLDAAGALDGEIGPLFPGRPAERVGARLIRAGDRFAVSFTQYTPAPTWEPRFAVLDETGAVLAQAPFAKREKLGGAITDLAWSPVSCDFGALHYVTPHRYFVRFAADGTITEPSMQLDGEDASDADLGRSLVWNGHAFATAWAEYPSGTIRIAELEGGAARIADLAPEPTALRLALDASGDRYALAWMARGGGGTDVHTSAAAPADRHHFETPEHSDSPTVWIDGAGNRLVAWADGKRIVLARYDAAGIPLTDEPVALTTPADGHWHGFPRFVPAGGCGFALVYQDVGAPLVENRMIHFR
jgi:hypothetical protein